MLHLRGRCLTIIGLVFVIILVCASIFVNGWTDAPNAIATVVSTRVLRPKTAVVLGAFFNLVGVFFMGTAVASTTANIVNIGVGQDALITLGAAQFSIVIWAVSAWKYGIPTSESHALIAGLMGAGISLNGLEAFNWQSFQKVLIGLVISSVVGFVLGYLATKLTEFICRNMNRRKTENFFSVGQVVSASLMAFSHGAQDGQKFMGVFMLGMFLAQGQVNVTEFQIPIWLMLLCSAVMALGTSIGGYRIIKSVGMDMVKLEKHQGFSADLAAAVCLLLASITGIPVSTTHTKTTAIMGVGAAKRVSSVNWGIVRDMAMAWVLTFPGCGLVGFLMAELFMRLF